MARPTQIPERVPLSEAEITAACYVGSGEHKIVRWWGGMPLARLDKYGKPTRPKKELTTICPKATENERDTATKWVRDALRNHQLRYFEGDKTFPKHIWYRDENGQFWFGFADLAPLK
ncbi:hypothetical protein [Sinorhizobium saheli]|uniref:Uncharacterized protein n=1 Tax=Sinorhizobium saheli TaxID=36856 RepID=A0A178YQT5_SINSA|nr:hypothetical protein [Sinorhizobium saheli]MQW89114.1 hypothetical protein [Sinorhizobium saheli]OAP49970.1 hypothetical protein ATB98_16740 [Sinorhizobium saheli]